MNVTLELVTPDTRDIVRHFFLEFFYALSEYDEYIYINDFGLPWYKRDAPPKHAEGPRTPKQAIRANWWIRGQCEQHIIRADGAPAGFVIIGVGTPNLDPGVDFDLMDFYIAPRYRRKGVGARAARMALDLHRGEWVIYQLQRNLPARKFWQGVVRDYTHGNFTQVETDYDVSQRFKT